MFVGFAALVALEWSLPGVLPHMALQSIRSSASVVALVTFEGLLSCVLPHHVNFQSASSDARIIARCAPVWLFSRVCPLVPLQVACLCCFVIALIAMVQFFPGVLLDMCFEVGRMVA